MTLDIVYIHQGNETLVDKIKVYTIACSQAMYCSGIAA